MQVLILLPPPLTFFSLPFINFWWDFDDDGDNDGAADRGASDVIVMKDAHQVPTSEHFYSGDATKMNTLHFESRNNA